MAPNASCIGPMGSHVGGWFMNVFEVVNSGRLELVTNARVRGYEDFKYAIYGSRLSGTLKIDFTTSQEGYVSSYVGNKFSFNETVLLRRIQQMFICDNPSLRKPHHIYDYIWNDRILLSLVHHDHNDEGQAVAVGYTHHKLFDQCITVDRLLVAKSSYTLNVNVNSTVGDNHVIFIASVLVP